MPSVDYQGRFSGFTPVPIRLSEPVKSSKRIKSKDDTASAQGLHHLWIRRHKTKGVKTGIPAEQNIGGPSSLLVKPSLMDSTKISTQDPSTFPSDRTLFIANVPVDMVEDDVRDLCKEYGAIEAITIRDSMGGRKEKTGVELWQDAEEDESESEDESSQDEEEQGPAEDESTHEAHEENGQRKELTSTVTDTNTSGSRKRRRKNGRGGQRGPSAPSVTPLPSLLPGDAPFLSPCSSAYVVFLSSLSLDRALEFLPQRTGLTCHLGPRSAILGRGENYYSKLHLLARPSLETIKDHADSSLALFDHYIARQQAQIAQGPIVDEDGFTLVVRGGRFGRTAGKGDEGVAVASKRFMRDTKKGLDLDAREGEARGKKRKNQLELSGFYRFQVNEQKKQGSSFFLFIRNSF